MCALSPIAMSAREEEGVVGERDDEDDDDEDDEDDDDNVSDKGMMRDFGQLAPIHFNVSVTTSGSACEEKEIDRAVTVSTSVSFCPCRLCGRRRRPLSCANCVNAGRFVHSKAVLNSSAMEGVCREDDDDDDDDDDLDLTRCFRVKAERMAVLRSRKANLVGKSLGYVDKASRLQDWNTRLLLQEEKLQLLRRSVEERKSANRTLKESVDEAKERAAQMQLRRRKHNEKVAKIQRFLPHSATRRDEKRKELEALKEELKTWRRNRIEHLVTHIFVVDEGVGQPPLPAQQPGGGGLDSSSLDPSASSTPTAPSPTRPHPPLPLHVPARAFVADGDNDPQRLESTSEPFVPSSHTGDPPNRKWSRDVSDAVVPLLLEVNKGFGLAGADNNKRGSRFDSPDDELPPTQLPVFEDILDEDLLVVDNDDDDDDDDDSIISELENSLMPMSLSRQDNESDDQTILCYGNPKTVNESYYRIIRPTLPASGDYAKILPLIVQSQKTSTPTLTVPDPLTGKMVQIEGHSSPRRIRIEKDLMQNAYAGLALTAQLVTCLSFYLDVILPKKVGPADFMVKSAKVSSFVKSVNKLNTNVLFLCFSQYVPLAVLHPSQMMHNLQMLLNTTVTPHLGSINHFRVDEGLLDSLEESVVIVGDASSGSNDADIDFSSSSSSSDDEGKDETSSGEWDYIPADMNIPSLPLNEGFAGGAESATLAGGLSSYSITGAAASVASWWRSNR